MASQQTSGQGHSPRTVAIAPRARQAYALPQQYQQAEEPSEPQYQAQPQYVPRPAPPQSAYQSSPPSSSAYYQQSRQPQVQLDESQLQALRKLRPSPESPRRPEEDFDVSENVGSQTVYFMYYL